MKQIEFSITAKPDLKFRTANIKAVEMLALQTQINFKDLGQTETVFNFILEHVEVEISGKYVPVKEKDREVYYPVGIDDDATALHQIILFFLNDILKPLFVKSNELSQSQP